MEIFIIFLEEVVRFFSLLEKLYHAWTMSPHVYVMIIGKIIIAIVIIMIVVVMWGIIKNLVGRRNR